MVPPGGLHPDPRCAEASHQGMDERSGGPTAPRLHFAGEDRVRGRVAMLALVGALAGCTQAPAPPPRAVPEFSIHPIDSSSSPAPLVQLQAGSVQAIFPEGWTAAPLPRDRFPQEGFVAADSLAGWSHAAGTVRGMEAFWIDVGKEGIPSDYYYLAARASLLGSLGTNKNCRSQARLVPSSGRSRLNRPSRVIWPTTTPRFEGLPGESRGPPSTISSMLHNFVVTPAAIAGVTRSVL